MSIFDCNNEISKYHDEKVTLGQNERNEMRERRDNGRKRLKAGLDENNYPQPTELCSQGSYRMWTMIQDAKCEYDIDDGVYFRDENLQDESDNKLSPSEARQRVCDALSRDQRFVKHAEVRKNCVRQQYHEGYHIDLPVYRIREADNGSQIFELASKDEWEISDARAVTRWFQDLVQELNVDDNKAGYQLRRLVRLTKRFARSRDDWKAKTTSGIIITKLITEEFISAPHRDDESLFKTWHRIESRLRHSTRVEHPINPSPLAKESDEKLEFFQQRLAEALETLKILEERDCTRNEARSAWGKVFNSSYITTLPDSDGEGDKRTVFITSEKKADNRDDGNGRYGKR